MSAFEDLMYNNESMKMTTMKKKTMMTKSTIITTRIMPETPEKIRAICRLVKATFQKNLQLKSPLNILIGAQTMEVVLKVPLPL
jgi:hypothetical protein